MYHGTCTSVCISKPQPQKRKETKCFHYMKIQQGIMPLKLTLILLVYLRARTPTHLACCHIQLGKVMSHAQQAVFTLHLFQVMQIQVVCPSKVHFSSTIQPVANTEARMPWCMDSLILELYVQWSEVRFLCISPQFTYSRALGYSLISCT